MFYNQQLNIMIILWYYIWSRNLLFNRLLTFTSFRSFSSSKPFASAPIESFPYSFEKSVLSNASFISFTWMKKKKKIIWFFKSSNVYWLVIMMTNCCGIFQQRKLPCLVSWQKHYLKFYYHKAQHNANKKGSRSNH